jgi:hypothetical protein
MVELIIERWSSFDGSVDYRWSVWHDGKRVQMGGPHTTADASEADALGFCNKALRVQPDRVTRL